MGIFDFVKEAGESLGSKVFDLTHDEQDAKLTTEVSQKRINELRALNIKKTLAALPLDTDSVQVLVKDDLAILDGSVPDQSTCEKVTLAAGNQHGIARIDCRLEVENPEPESVFYTVKPGDTLSKIAKAHYGNAGKYQLIFEANQPMLSDPNKIYPGQELRIPSI